MGTIRILIVEDDTLCRFGLAAMIKEFGTIDEAANGFEAFSMVKKAYEEKKPYQLILLDIMMPVMNGQDALHEIRKYEDSIGIIGSDGCKIMMTTALSDAKTIMTAFKGQCEAFLTKPYQKKTLIEQLKNIGIIA